MAIDQGHWTGKKVDPKRDFGFVYMIHDKRSGKKYIGRKQCWMAKPGVKGCKSKVADRGSPKWKECCWKESDWREYKGSSKSLKEWMKYHKHPDYEYIVLRTCRSRGVLTYCECMEQWDRRVLHKTMPNGELEFFNGQIGAVKYRPRNFKESDGL